MRARRDPFLGGEPLGGAPRPSLATETHMVLDQTQLSLHHKACNFPYSSYIPIAFKGKREGNRHGTKTDGMSCFRFCTLLVW